MRIIVEMTDALIRKAYYDPNEGFVGATKLFRRMRARGEKVSLKEVQNFLAKQEVYQVNRKNNRRQTSFVPRYPLHEFQIDLIYLEHKHLNEASYGLCCIDAFTKKADIELMKRKTKGQTVDAMIAILERMGVPTIIYCDEGSEFTNHEFKKLCKELGIKLVFTIRHAPIVERFNRTIKEMIYKYLQSTNTKTITNVLKKLLNNYNNSYHSTIGMAPNQVNENTQHMVQLKLIHNLNISKKDALKVGDRVRVQVKPQSFVKGYKPKFSKEVYSVTEKGEGFYLTTKDKRPYFRANLQKVESYEINPEKPDLEGTREGHLKSMRRRRASQLDDESEEEVEPISQRRSKRERRPTNRVLDEFGNAIIF
jgi:transposase InsO family protein